MWPCPVRMEVEAQPLLARVEEVRNGMALADAR
jgi:hypothetical protein